MKILDGLLGEYIYITKTMYPNVFIFYNDKKVIKSEEVSDVKKNIEIIANKLKCKDSDYCEYVLNNIERIQEVVFNKNGLIRFSMGVNDE